MSAKIPAFADIGKTAKDILLGGSGHFQYDQRVSLSSKTSDGVEFTANSVKRGDKLDTQVKAAYKINSTYSTALTFLQAGKVIASVNANDVTPGLSLGLTGTLPDAHSAKATIDYYLPHLTIKALVGVTSAPVVTASVTSGWNELTFGAQALYDSAKNENVQDWSAAIGYTGLDYQVAATLANKGEVLKVTGAHNIDTRQAVAAEISRQLNTEEAPTIITLAFQRRLDNGSLAKIKLDNSGSVQTVYEQDLQKNTKLAFSGHFDATNLEAAPKIGVAFDIKN